jgi:peptidoglycan/xylan/chitin deacetylase (PgdA/CDA1 family)
VRAKLRTAGTSLLLAASLCTAVIAADPETTISSVAVAAPMGALDLPSGPHERAGGHVVLTSYIPLGRARISVPILMYHYVQDLPPNVGRLTYNLSISVKAFQAEMDLLAADSFHPVTIDDLRLYFTGQRALPSKPVVLTFDDGYLDLYTTVFPILKQHGFRAVAYIVSGFVDRPRYVTSSMVKEMDFSGIEIASHTVDHPNLARTSAPLVAFEVVQSKAWLEKLVGHPVVDFAYPSGRFDDAVVRALQAAGYSTATTEMESTYHSWTTRYVWTRTRVYGGELLPDFVKNLGQVEPYVIVKPTPA